MIRFTGTGHKCNLRSYLAMANHSFTTDKQLTVSRDNAQLTNSYYQKCGKLKCLRIQHGPGKNNGTCQLLKVPLQRQTGERRAVTSRQQQEMTRVYPKQTAERLGTMQSFVRSVESTSLNALSRDLYVFKMNK